MAAAERAGRVAAVADLGGDTRSLVLALDEPLAFRAGQFVSCLLPVDGERLIRPYSIASDPSAPTRLELVFDVVPGGRGSRHLHALRVGDAVAFTGPWGTFTLDDVPAVETVFIADRTGIAPIRALIRHHAPRARHFFRLLYGTRRPLFLDELVRLPQVTGEVVDPGRLVAVTTARFVDADADRTRRFFVCGIGPVVHALRDLLRGAGYARRAVQYEKW